jgi:hypothetical protein
MWVGVASAATGSGISGAWFNVPFQNYGNGWYWVEIGQNSWLIVSASRYGNASEYTNGHTSLSFYLMQPLHGLPSGSKGK